MKWVKGSKSLQIAYHNSSSACLPVVLTGGFTAGVAGLMVFGRSFHADVSWSRIKHIAHEQC